LTRGRLRHKLPKLRQALEGRFRVHHRFLLGQILAHLDFLDESIAEVSREVAVRIIPFTPQIELLKTIPGVEQKVAEAIISEIGKDMDRFGTARHLASWAGLCPGNNESAGKRISGKTRKGDRWLRRTWLQAAWGAIIGITFTSNGWSGRGGSSFILGRGVGEESPNSTGQDGR